MKTQSKIQVRPNEPRAAGASELPLYLFIRDGVYYFKRKIPAAFIQTLEDKAKVQNQKWLSLDTKDLPTAIRLLERANLAFNKEYLIIEDKTKPSRKRIPEDPETGTTKYLMAAHIPVILTRYEYGILSTDDDERAGITPEEIVERISYLEGWLQTCRNCAASGDFSPIKEVISELLVKERLVAAPGSKNLVDLTWELLRKDMELVEIQIGRLRGHMVKTPKKLPAGPRELPTMMDLYDAWAKSQREVRTRNTYLGYVKDFESRFNAIPIVSLDYIEHGLGFRDYLAGFEFARATVSNRVGGIATLFAYGLSEKLFDSVMNPFSKINFDMIPETPVEFKRRAFEIAEVRAIFRAPLYMKRQFPGGQAAEAAYWLPLMGPFVGARIEELAQLLVGDIVTINGVWAIRISNLDPEQHLKNPGSFRYVPIHEELIKCGFLVYVASQKLAGQKRLFPSLKNNNKYKRYSNAVGKWHGRFLDSAGLNDVRLCYHSYRFLFRQWATICDIPKEARDALTGHWMDKKDSGKGYLSGQNSLYPFPALVLGIKKIKYTELDFSHLYVSNPYLGVAEAFGKY